MLQVILLIVPLEALQEFCRLDDNGFRKIRGRMELVPFLLPFLPLLRLIPKRGLSSVSYNRRPDHGRIFQNLLQLILIRDILDQRKRILIFSIPIDHIFDSAVDLCNRTKLAFAHSLLFHVNKLIFDTALFKEPLCLLRIIALFRAKNLYVQNIITPSLSRKYALAGNCSVSSQLRAKIHSKSAVPIGFFPYSLSFLTVSAVNARTY